MAAEPPKTINPNENNILCLYNQYPRSYKNLQEMTNDLIRIAKMGFNAVWVNPLHVVSKFEIQREKIKVQGSLYAITDYKILISSRLGNEQDIFVYTKTAKNFGLTPIFDLVLRHVGIGCDLTTNHSNWFKSYYPKKPMNDVVDFIYIIPDDESEREKFEKEWNQIYIIWQKEIFPFWQDYIKRMIKIGFQGIRVDAIRYLPALIQKDIYEFTYDMCIQEHRKPPVIFAELLFGEKEDRNAMVRKMKEAFGNNSKLTHITNSLYYLPFNFEARKKQLWKGRNNDTPDILTSLCSVVKNGGTIGFGGSHDELPLSLHALQDYLTEKERKKIPKWEVIKKANLLDDRTIANNVIKRMKQIITAVAFTSNGGWYLMCGDEFGHKVKKDVFINLYEENFANWYQSSSHMDICQFIKTINMVLLNLPKPNFEDWFEHIPIDKNHDLMVIVRHHGKAFAETSLIIINIGENLTELTESDFLEIADKAQDFNQFKDKNARDTLFSLKAVNIICSENVTIHPDLLSQLTGGLKL